MKPGNEFDEKAAKDKASKRFPINFNWSTDETKCCRETWIEACRWQFYQLESDFQRCDETSGKDTQDYIALKNILSEHKKMLVECEKALKGAVEHTSSNLEDMEHYFDNKCCPTSDEVNQCAVADSKLRLALSQLQEWRKRMGGEK